MAIIKNPYKYFLYSEEQLKEKNQVLEPTGKMFVPGTVVVNGTRKKFTQLSNSAELPRFIDTKLIAEGHLNNFTYTAPSITRRRGN